MRAPHNAIDMQENGGFDAASGKSLLPSSPDRHPRSEHPKLNFSILSPSWSLYHLKRQLTLKLALGVNVKLYYLTGRLLIVDLLDFPRLNPNLEPWFHFIDYTICGSTQRHSM